MNHSEADRIINELTTRFEPRFDAIDARFDTIDQRLSRLETGMDDVRTRVVSLEGAMENIVVEQRTLRYAVVSNLDEMNRLRRQFQAQVS
jgi:hypothetical protein